MPALHATQAAEFVAPVEPEAVPAGQEVHCVPPVAAWYLAVEQLSHTEAVEAEYLPTAQGVQASLPVSAAK